MRNLCYMAAICIAAFFYYVPARSEPEPDMQDNSLYTMCTTVLGKDGKWLWRQMTKRGIKTIPTPRLCGAASPFLLPSQETPNFFNRRMCRDHDVLSGILTAAINTLQTKVTVAGSDGPKTPGDPDDIHLEAVSILDDGKGAIICSVTISAKGITERMAYSVGPSGTPGSYENSWVIKFGGGPGVGAYKLFPEMIEVRRPRPSEVPPPTSPPRSPG